MQANLTHVGPADEKVTSAMVQRKFSRVREMVGQGNPVVVTIHGKDEMVILDMKTWQRLAAMRPEDVVPEPTEGLEPGRS